METATFQRTVPVSEQARKFWRDGFVMLRGAFSPSEVEVLRDAIVQSQVMTEHFKHVQAKFLSGDYPSFESIFVWNDTSGQDVFAKFTRSYKVLDILESVFEDSVYVYHNKVALKYPNMPGFRHHQDYFYWYAMGCLLPNMATCFIAVDPATRANGCLRLIEGSHRLGRVDHTPDGPDEGGVESARLAEILKRMPERELEMEPGDVVIFHANTIHASEANHSNERRLALLGCYNTRMNDPYRKDMDHPGYILQSKVYAPVTQTDLARLPDYTLSYRQAP